jgi:predicted nucleotidyltransferase
MNPEQQFELHKNYRLPEVRAILGADFGRTRSTAPRPRRPIPTTLEDLEPEISASLAAIVDIFRKFLAPGYSLYLTGSRAKGYWIDESDWDIVVVGGGCDRALAATIKAAGAEQNYALDVRLSGKTRVDYGLLIASG